MSEHECLFTCAIFYCFERRSLDIIFDGMTLSARYNVSSFTPNSSILRQHTLVVNNIIKPDIKNTVKQMAYSPAKIGSLYFLSAAAVIPGGNYNMVNHIILSNERYTQLTDADVGSNDSDKDLVFAKSNVEVLGWSW